MRSSLPPRVFPALGHDVSLIYRTHSKDLTAQKVRLPAPSRCNCTPCNDYNLGARKLTVNEIRMDWKLPVSVVMLVAWVILTVAFAAPGYVHLLLVFGVFLLIWGIAERGAPPQRSARTIRPAPGVPPVPRGGRK